MTADHVTYFLLFWGVWLLIPLVMDVIEATWRLAVVARAHSSRKPYPPLPNTGLPRVSVVVPAYNEQVNIDRCITSLKAQTYPHSLIEVLVVNDGSTDHTSDVVIGHMSGMGHWNGHIRLHNHVIPARDFGGVINLLRGRKGGKPAAVNAGLAQTTGDIVITLDSDMVLERDAIEQAVMAFLSEPDMMAATAHLIIDDHLLVEADDRAQIALDDHGFPIQRRIGFSERILSACQFIEYLTAFHVGRQAESATDTIFTLSGACAIYRAEALSGIGGYRARTVSEDTDATLALHRAGWRIGYLPQAHVRLAPVTNWTHLYSQRVRWQRGQLEVIAVNTDKIEQPAKSSLFWQWALRLRLQSDHSLAVPRLIWTLLIFMLAQFGYPLTVILQALAMMYGLYVVTEGLQAGMSYALSRKTEQQLLRMNILYIVLMPLYRMITFWYRMSGVMITLSEDAAWNVRGKGQQRALPARALDVLQSLANRLVAFWAN